MAKLNNDIIKSNESIIKELKRLNKQFSSKLKYDEQKDRTIEQLHSELQKYKQDLYKKMLLPMVNDLIHFIEREERDINFLAANPPSSEKLLKRFFDLFDDMRDILYNQGIDPYKEIDDVFNPKRQKILKKIVTGDFKKDKKVANHKTWGYEWEGKIIKAEGVDLYIYKDVEEEKTIVENKSKEIKVENVENVETIFDKEENTNEFNIVPTDVSSPKKKKDDSFTIEMDFADEEDGEELLKYKKPYKVEKKSDFDELESTNVSSPKKKNIFLEDLADTNVSSPKKKEEIIVIDKLEK